VSPSEYSDASSSRAKFRPAVEGTVKADGEIWASALVGGRCRNCGTVTLTMKPICPFCWKAGSQEEAALSQRGVLYAFTIVHHPPPGAAGPYAIAYVDLPENLRVMVRGDLETVQGLTLGCAVAIAVEPLGVDADGTIVVGPMLKRIATGKGGR
jgi:uncharacterized OB-fold protein